MRPRSARWVVILAAAIFVAAFSFIDDVKHIRPSLRFGFRAHPGTVAEYALYRGDAYLVGYLGGFRALGYYSFDQPLAELVWILSISVRLILYAETARSDAERATRLAAAAVRFTLLLGSALAVGTFVFGVLSCTSCCRCSVLTFRFWPFSWSRLCPQRSFN